LSLDFVVLIPARLQSSRLPGKPLLDLAGTPMVVRCAQAAAASGAQRIAVATDAEEIAEVVRRAGFEALMTRADHASGTDRLAEAADLLGLGDDDIVVNLQGDEPLMPPDLIYGVAECLAQHPESVMATVVHPIHDLATFLRPEVVKVVLDAEGHAVWFSRSPIPWPRDAMITAPEIWPEGFTALRHMGLYSYRRHFLPVYAGLSPSAAEMTESLEQLRVLHHGHRISALTIDSAPPGGVDTPEDAARVRLQIDRTEKVR
jgi:3-deoxy-manno-octulosonate cytidylyltransferase (CMP-KDO synthetase)